MTSLHKRMLLDWSIEPATASIPVGCASNRATGPSQIVWFNLPVFIPFEPRHEKTCFSQMRTIKVPVHPCSLISTFVVRYSNRIIPILAKSKISRLYLVSVAEQARLSLT